MFCVGLHYVESCLICIRATALPLQHKAGGQQNQSKKAAISRNPTRKGLVRFHWGRVNGGQWSSPKHRLVGVGGYDFNQDVSPILAKQSFGGYVASDFMTEK